MNELEYAQYAELPNSLAELDFHHHSAASTFFMGRRSNNSFKYCPV